MFASFSPCLAFTMRPENDGGPFHIDPDDPGGATKWGITIATLTEWRVDNGCPIPLVSGLENLSEDERDAIYATRYWARVNGDALPSGVDLMAFDFGVNSGAALSARAVQRAVGFAGSDVDGWIGPQTIQAIANQASFELVSRLAELQDAYYRARRQFALYGRGWERRLDDRRRLAVSMFAGVKPVVD